MKKIRHNIIGCIILFLTLFVTWVTPVHADNTVAQLTLHAYGTALGSSNNDVGHAFLSIKNTTDSTLNFLDYPIPAKEMITISIWPDKMSPIKSGGVYINWEMVECKNTNTSSISIDITQQQLNKIAQNSPKESYYHDGRNDTFTNYHDAIWHNCTTYSTKMWNLVAPKQYKITDGFLGADAPKWVSEKINKMSGHLNAPFVPGRKVSSSDIFYVTKKKDLIPVNLKTPNLYSTKASKNTVSLKWESSKKWLLNNQYNITGSFTTSKAPRASIKLNKSKITIYKGKAATLKATVTGASTKVSWKSSNTKVASVNSKGKIFGKNPGTCKITASANGKSTTCTVTVKRKTSAEMRTASEFYSWYRTYANNGKNYRIFTFYASTANNLNKIIK